MNEEQHEYDIKTKMCVCGKKCAHLSKSVEWYQTLHYHYKKCNSCLAECSITNHSYNAFSMCKTCKYIKGSIPMTNSTVPKEEVKAYKVDVRVSQPTPYNQYFSTTGGGNYKVGTNVKVSTSGSTFLGQVKFDGWYLDGALVSTSKSYSFTMPTKDVSLIAKWVYKEDNEQICEHENAPLTGTWNEYDYSYHYRKCADCGEVIERDKHELGGKIYIGKTHYKECSICNNKLYGI